MSNIAKAIESIINSAPGLCPESRATALEYLEQIVEDSNQLHERRVSFTVTVDPAPFEALQNAAEKIKGELEATIFNHARANGYTMPPAGSEWIPIDRVSELEHREGVIVTDGKTWGLSHYNAHRPKTPFPVIYDVCDWDTLGEITHVRRMTAIALPDGSLMVEPQPVVLNRNATECPDCKKPLQWHQMHGMRLLEEVKVNGKPVTVYKARCVDCGQHHWVRK